MQGRGGAGNFVQSVQDPVEGREPLTGMYDSEQIRTKTEREVEAGLAVPSKAYLGGRERESKLEEAMTAEESK